MPPVSPRSLTFDRFDALLVAKQENIRYLTGFTGANPSVHEAYALITPDHTLLMTNSLYTQRARRIKGIRIKRISRSYPVHEALRDVVHDLGIRRIGIEEQTITVAEHRAMAQRLGNHTFIPADGAVEALREIKRSEELVMIQKAARITDACMRWVRAKIVPGTTERSLAALIERYFLARGAKAGFSPIVAFGSHGAEPHYEPSGTPLTSGMSVLVDIGAEVEGYHADLSRIFFTGYPGATITGAYHAVMDARSAALALLEKPGVVQGDRVDQIARNVIRNKGFRPYTHSIGHGVGLSIHESPRLTRAVPCSIMPGMVFTIEPAVYLPGIAGIRIEDLVMKTETGIRILSTAPQHDPPSPGL